MNRGRGSSLPPGIAGFEPYLGPFGMSQVLAEAGIGGAHQPLPGLPVAPEPGAPDLVEHASAAMAELLARFPVGHLLVPADLVLLRALKRFAAPATVWLPPDASADVVNHFHGVASAGIDLAVAPALPPPRGSLPALVVLGGLAGCLSFLPWSSRTLVDLYTAERVLGLCVLIDPTDAPAGGSVRQLGWPSVWTSHFTAAIRPAEAKTSVLISGESS